MHKQTHHINVHVYKHFKADLLNKICTTKTKTTFLHELL